ncbi:MAG: Flp pilus assembly complex ATPase component TadA [Firmicutes bacterium]|nr:Flp pilus assembly complex ATPase component TadA [Bacillota bacterium]
MLELLLPSELFLLVEKEYNAQRLNEIRIRLNSAVVVCVAGVNKHLSMGGSSIIATRQLIDGILYRATHNSLYAFNEQIKQGFVTYSGIRLGIAGRVIKEKDDLKTVKDITSLNIRVPCVVKTSGQQIYSGLFGEQIYNTLVLSPPGAGKTSMLRDFASLLSRDSRMLNVLIADEREEITFNKNLTNVDVFLNCTKTFAFTNGIRSMRPDIIITDEIGTESDIHCIEQAITCGVKVIATAHANNLQDLSNKKNMKYLLDMGLFERFIVLSTRSGIGTLEGVYDSAFSKIF